MSPKLSTLIALSMLVLSAVHGFAQTATGVDASGRRIWNPQGRFSGRVLTRGSFPYPVPMADTTATSNRMIMPYPNTGVSGATVRVSARFPIFYKDGPQPAKGGFLPPQQVFTTVTGQDGGFSFQNLSAGSYTYTVTHGEYATANGSFTIRGRSGTTETIYLKRNANQIGSFAGRVTVTPRWPILYARPAAASGTSSSDPALAAEANDASAQAPLDADEAAADALTVPEAGATPPADAASYDAAVAPTSAAAAAPAANASSMTVAKGLYWGRGLAGAQVEVTFSPWFYNIRPAAASDAQPQSTSMIAPINRTYKATTDASGNFGIKNLGAGRYTYRVTHKYFQPRGGSFTVGSTETDVWRNIQLDRRVRGTFAGVVGEGPQSLIWNIRPAAGETNGGNMILPFKFTPLPGARVVVMRSRYLTFPRAATAIAGGIVPQANAAVAAPADAAAAPAEEQSALLKASESDGADAAATDDTASDAALADAEANAGAAPDSANAAAAGAIAPNSARMAMPQPMPLVMSFRRATTDQNGRFSIASLAAGSYLYVVRDNNHQPQIGTFSISMRAPRVYRRVLLPSNGGPGPIEPSSISGTVLGYTIPLDVVYIKGGGNIRAPDTIRPLSGAQVSLSAVARPGEVVAQVLQTTTTDANGNFSFSGQSFGARYVLYISAQGYYPGQQDGSVGSGSRGVKVYLKPQLAVPYENTIKPTEAAPVGGSDVEDPFKK